ncbi:MAG: enhanced serine sensitivity protein SseB C-terminal domain-containing protein [Janthinobacterium lividum]
MGLLDFLKNKPDTPVTPPAPAATPAAGDTPAPKAGPRYQGSNYVAPAEPALPVPPMPPQFQPAASPAPELPFEPQNALEQLLLLASTEEQARPAFYQALLQENIIMVLAPEAGLAPGEVQLAEGQQIQLQVLQDGRLPIFTSPDRLNDGGLDHSGMSWVWIPGHAFFSMTQGQDSVLNPFSPAGKLLPTDELAALLRGELTQQAGLPPDAQVTLSAPAELPEGLPEALANFGAAHPTLAAIYLAQMQLAGAAPEEPARLLLGFVSTDQDPEFMQDLGPALEGHTGQFQHVDLMLLDMNSDEGVNPYFRQPEVQPLYQA